MKKFMIDAFQEKFQKTLTEARSALQTVEEEVTRRYRQVLERTDLPHSSEEIQQALTELGRRLQKNSEQMEGQLQERVRMVVDRVKAPLMEELARLKEQAEALSQRVDVQVRRRKETGGAEAVADASEQDDSSSAVQEGAETRPQ